MDQQKQIGSFGLASGLSLGWSLLCPLLAHSLCKHHLHCEVNTEEQAEEECVGVTLEFPCSSGSICSISIWPWESTVAAGSGIQSPQALDVRTHLLRPFLHP